jgi:hypothetical protein
MSVNVTVWDPTSPKSEVELATVLALHKANKATLGPMPDTAFRERARHHGLLLGTRQGQVAAYMLYDIPRHNLIKIVHLCVSDSARGSGFARALTDAAIGLNPRRSMITAACRTDYGIDDFWRSLGMYVASEKPGRALSGSMLANWVKRINIENGLDLLEMASLESGLPLAVLDTNIIGDLYAPSSVRRDHREETAELKTDWVQPLVTFAVSGEVDNEISEISDVVVRTTLRGGSAALTRLSTRRPTDRSLEDALLGILDPSLTSKDPSLVKDVLQVADAVHAGADYFVTNDGNVRDSFDTWEPMLRGTRVVRPHELLGSLTPQSFLSDFRSNLIDGSDLEWTRLTEADPALEPIFRVYDLEQKPADFHRRVRGLLARPKEITLEVLRDGEGRIWALAGVEHAGQCLRLHLLRAIRGERGATVAFQLLRHFRRTALANGAVHVEVTDPAVSSTLDAALRADGFNEATPRVARLGPSIANARDLNLGTALEVVLAERQLWPMTVVGAGLPTYVIPIRPGWGSRLLGLNDGLFLDRRRGLGLSRELVYFSGSRVVPRSLPARVLWYASGDKTIQMSRIVARSVMVDVVRLPAGEAVERFAHLGVLRKSDIQRTAGKTGKVSVIRFQDTELLTNPISMRDEVFKRYVNGEVRSMRSVAAEFFDEILARQDAAATTE